VGALAEGFVSVTPLQLDLTAYRALTDLNTWQWEDAHHETTVMDSKLTLFRTDCASCCDFVSDSLNILIKINTPVYLRLGVQLRYRLTTAL